MGVYFYPSNTETELQNAYIGEYVEVTSLTLDKSSISLTTVGQTEQITATTVPAGATVTWSSSDTTIATVSDTGLVTCVTPGNCTITATSFGVTATCSVINAAFMYSYDFRNSNTADVQSAGFSIDYTTTLEYSNNGVRVTKLNGAAKSSVLTKSVDFSNASKIEIIANVYQNVSTWAGSVSTGPSLDNSWAGLNYVVGRIWATTNYGQIIDIRGHYQGNGSEAILYGTPESGNQTLKFIVDLVGGTATSYRILNGNTISISSTLSSSQISSIKSCPYRFIRLDGGDGGSYLGDISITVE